MNNIKKVVCISLAMLMLIAMFPLTASALTTYVGDFGFTIDAANQEATIVSYTGNEPEPQIPSSVYGYTVTKINNQVFSGNISLKKVVVPDSITAIGNYAFINCTLLEEVIIPASVDSLGMGIFCGCSALSKAEINASVSTLPQSFFYDCSSLSDVSLSDSIINYGGSAFRGCLSLTYAPSIENVQSIGQSAFYNSGLTQAVIPEGVTELPGYVFADCSSLKAVMVPDTVTQIEPSAFTGSENITIYCWESSSAHLFAQDNSIPYLLLQKGDTNLDGRIDISDTTEIQKHIAGIVNLSDFALPLADIDGDKLIQIADATELQKAIVGLVEL